MTRFGYFVLAVLLVALGAAGYWWYRASRPTPASERPISMSVVRSALLLQTKLSFPVTTSSVPIAPPDIPIELSSLILAGATEPEVYSIMYDDGRRGYRIELRTVAELFALQQSYRTTIGDGGWTILHSVRGSQFAFIEAENSRYQIRIELTQFTTAIIADIQVIAK